MKIWKRTIVIYTNYDPEDFDIEDLSREAMSGEGFYLYSDEELEDPLEELELSESDFFHRCVEDSD